MYVLIWILVFLAFWVAGTLCLGWLINHISLSDIREYNDHVDRNLRAVELERLNRLPTQSRIRNRPDL